MQPDQKNTILSPGEYLRKVLKEKNISQKSFASVINMPYQSFNKYIIGTKKFDAKMALILEKTLDISAETWLTMQCNREINAERHNLHNIRLLAGIPPVEILEQIINEINQKL